MILGLCVVKVQNTNRRIKGFMLALTKTLISKIVPNNFKIDHLSDNLEMYKEISNLPGLKKNYD